MEDILVKLQYSIPKLNEFFNTKDFLKVLHEFDFYSKNVEKHYEEFEETKRAWANLLDQIPDNAPKRVPTAC